MRIQVLYVSRESTTCLDKQDTIGVRVGVPASPAFIANEQLLL